MLARVFLNRLGWGRESGSGAAISRIPQSVVVVDTADAVAQFRTLNRDIHLFCDKTAANINKIYLIPAEPYRPDNPDVPKRAPIHFPSTEDYWYFVLLSIMNCALCRYIFDPFHPSDWLDERGSSGGYGHANANVNPSQIPQLQSEAARLRSTRFWAIESQCFPAKKNEIFHRISVNIKYIIGGLLPTTLPDWCRILPEFDSELHQIWNAAYEWNCTAKRDVLDYDVKPFVVAPESPWEPMEMEPFEKVRDPDDPKVISPVSLGLKASTVAYAGGTPRVQLKAKVLVDTWFQKPPPPASGEK